MASKFNGFLDNISTSIVGPKGNMADWQHASRLFVNDNQRLAPKTKFLYHCHFTLDPAATNVLPDLRNKHNLEIGMLVSSADLPRYRANVETKNKYNRKKNVQTSIQYEPITITFHDDNYGVTTALLEAYYRYYFADGNYGSDPGAFNKAGSGDNTYLGSGRNQFKYGLDNNISVPFFRNIQISQMARKSYTTYTLVNPIITNWQHDTVDSKDGSSTMKNTITVAYEAVHYSRGNVEAGANGNPTGFGDTSHYDVTPSSITLLGGGTLGLDGIFGSAIDLYDYITKGKNFNNPLEAGIAAVNIISNFRSLTKEGLREQGFRILTGAIGAAAGIDVSGVAQTFFPKNGGKGSAKDLAIATVAVAGLSAISSSVKRNELLNNPAALDAAKRKQFASDYQANGGAGGINEINAAYNAQGPAQQQALENKVLGN